MANIHHLRRFQCMLDPDRVLLFPGDEGLNAGRYRLDLCEGRYHRRRLLVEGQDGGAEPACCRI